MYIIYMYYILYICILYRYVYYIDIYVYYIDICIYYIYVYIYVHMCSNSKSRFFILGIDGKLVNI